MVRVFPPAKTLPLPLPCDRPGATPPKLEPAEPPLGGGAPRAPAPGGSAAAEPPVGYRPQAAVERGDPDGGGERLREALGRAAAAGCARNAPVLGPGGAPISNSVALSHPA